MTCRIRLRLLPALVCVASSLLSLGACKSTQLSSSKVSEFSGGGSLPDATQKLWDDYVQKQSGISFQSGCAPLQMSPNGPSKGLVVIYHGFTGCPTQFINVARELNDEGFSVLLPTLPGNGRTYLNQAEVEKRIMAEGSQNLSEQVKLGKISNIIKDDHSGIPLSTAGYYQYGEEMTRIAQSYPGPRVLIGLSLGGGLAVATLIKGADLKAPTEANVWTRGLLITPFFKAPSIQGVAARIIGTALPQFEAGFGDGCESGQLKEGYRKRNGICDFTAGHIETLQKLGREVGTKEQMSKIQIPVQVIGQANDKTADVSSMINAFGFTAASLTRICFYPDDVSHALIIDADFALYSQSHIDGLPNAKARNAVPRFDRNWARKIQDQIIDFSVHGFGEKDLPFALSSAASTEKNKNAKACELKIDYDEVLRLNREVCSNGTGESDYCSDLEASFTASCDPTVIGGLPETNAFKAYCNSMPKK